MAQKQATPSTIRDRGESAEERPFLITSLPDLLAPHSAVSRMSITHSAILLRRRLRRSLGGKHFAIGEQDRKLYYDFYCTFCTAKDPKERPPNNGDESISTATENRRDEHNLL